MTGYEGWYRIVNAMKIGIESYSGPINGLCRYLSMIEPLSTYYLNEAKERIRHEKMMEGFRIDPLDKAHEKMENEMLYGK